MNVPPSAPLHSGEAPPRRIAGSHGGPPGGGAPPGGHGGGPPGGYGGPPPGGYGGPPPGGYGGPPPGGYGGPPPGGYGGPPPGGYGAAPPGGLVGPVGGAMMPHAPYGIDPVTGLPFSDKSKVVAGLLQIILGWCGAGRFYTGHTGLAIAQFAVSTVTCGFGALWPIVDGIMMLTGKVPDSEGRPLRD